MQISLRVHVFCDIESTFSMSFQLHPSLEVKKSAIKGLEKSPVWILHPLLYLFCLREEVTLKTRIKIRFSAPKNVFIDMKFFKIDHLRFCPFMVLFFCRRKGVNFESHINKRLKSRSDYWHFPQLVRIFLLLCDLKFM